MTATPESWRVGVKKGDVLSVSATYDTRRASWYESMGIMISAFNPGGTGPDPFVTNVDVPGEVTDGHLPRTATTAARSAACPTRGGCSPPRRPSPAPSRSAASSTGRATSA